MTSNLTSSVSVFLGECLTITRHPVAPGHPDPVAGVLGVK